MYILCPPCKYFAFQPDAYEGVYVIVRHRQAYTNIGHFSSYQHLCFPDRMIPEHSACETAHV